MVGVSGRGGKNSKAVREFKASGNKAMQAGAFQKAMRLYTKALEIDAGNAILYSNRSAAHFNVRQFAESLEDAESAILCDSMWWKAYKRKGLALIHMQRYEDAIQALEEGLKIVGKNAEMEKNLEFARACQEQAQNLYILPEPHMMQRLESVPVFIVTDSLGQPFFVTYDDGQQVCTFYFDQEDAKATLDWIKSENPDLGDTARVINITLHQAFNLAQETQKQYYEETTRAAAEEDRVAAAAAKDRLLMAKEQAKKDDNQTSATDKNYDDWEDAVSDDKEAEEDSTAEQEAEKKGDKEDTKPEGSSEPSPEGKTDDDSEATVAKDDADSAKASGDDDKKDEDPVIDDNAPLSFQFRPELRQVQVAVELLNKHPNPPVRPILRDPPSVRKAKAEAAVKEKAEAATSAAEADDKTEVKTETNEDSNENGTETNTSETTKAGDMEDETPETNKTDSLQDEASGTTEDSNEKGTETNTSETTKAGAMEDETSETNKTDSSKDEASGTTKDDEVTDKGDGLGDDDVELTVDNFNGIPIFQAKGLTLLQKNKQLIPLFFSKWDLEAAWKQLKESNAIDIPGECEIDVGTLEDVLRRMSECKTDEFESVFFVPSRESMKAINVKFPLDELAPPASRIGLGAVRGVKKAGFSKAKQIAARGGTKDEVRAAIREDLEKHAERQRMAEIIAQIEQARRTGGVGGVGSVGLGAAGGAAGSSTKNGSAGIKA